MAEAHGARGALAPPRGVLLNLVYVAQVLLCGYVGIVASRECGTCLTSDAKPLLAVAGLLFYSLGLALRTSVFPQANRIWAPLAAGAHVVLATELAAQGTPCVACIAVAVGAFVLLGAELPKYSERHFVIIGFLVSSAVPLSAATRPFLAFEEYVVFTTATKHPAAREEDFDKRRLTVVVLVRDGCAYCVEFERWYAPRLESRFGDELPIRYVNAAKTLRPVRVTPTLLIGRSASQYVVVEGLPSYPTLENFVLSQLPQRSQR